MGKSVPFIARGTPRPTHVKVTVTKRAHVIGLEKIVTFFATRVQRLLNAPKEEK